jgi:hypothetical protein
VTGESKEVTAETFHVYRHVADPQLTTHKRGQSLSVLNLGCELIYALVVGPLPLSLLDRPLPAVPQNTL